MAFFMGGQALKYPKRQKFAAFNAPLSAARGAAAKKGVRPNEKRAQKTQAPLFCLTIG